MSHKPTSILGRTALALALTGGSLVALAGTAGATEAGSPCALTGVQYSNGTFTTANLRSLNLRAGQTLTVTWNGSDRDCVAPVGISAYSAGAPLFDPSDIQETMAVVAGSSADRSLALLVPPSPTCNIQVDVYVGPAIDSFPGNGLYGLRLVGAANWGGDCAPEPEEPGNLPEVPVVPVPEPEVIVTPAPEPTPEPIVVVVPEPEAPVVVDEAPVVVAEPEVVVVAESVAVLAASVTRDQLPHTASSDGILALIGAGLLAAGAAVVAMGRKLA